MGINIKDVLIRLSNKIQSLLNTYFLYWNTLELIFSNSYNLSLTNINNGTDWKYSELYVQLVGHVVHIHVRSKRSSATKAGDIVNQEVISFDINHGGKLKGLFSTSTGNMDGSIATLHMSVSNSGNVSTVTIKLAATHQALTNVYIDDCIPAEIDLSHPDWVAVKANE